MPDIIQKQQGLSDKMKKGMEKGEKPGDGEKGEKSGEGFYDYSETDKGGSTTNGSQCAVKAQPVKDDALYQQIFMRIISMLINEAVEAKRLGIATDEDLELAMQKGVNYPKGLLAWGKEIGYAKISETLQNLYEEYQEERYRQSPLLRKL